MRRALSVVAILFALCNPALADFYAPYSGSTFEGLTRASTIFESDSTVDAAGLLVDKSGSNYLTYSEDMTSWTQEGGATTSANTARCPANGQLTADTVNVTNAAGIYNRFITSGTTWEPSIWIKKISTSGTLRMQNPEGFVSGYLDINLASLPDTWVYIHRNSPYVTWGANFVPAGGGPRVGMYFLRNGVGTVSFYACAAQLAQTDANRKGPGIYHPTVTANKPLLDLSPTATPTESKSYLQGQDGRRLRARTFNGTTQYYSKAHDASMNVFDTDHTVTMLFNVNSVTAARRLLTHSSGVNTGFEVYIAQTTGVVIVMYKGAAAITTVLTSSALQLNTFNELQLVRNANIVKLFLNGVLQQVGDVTNKGVDDAILLALGASSIGTGFYSGDILYTRIDAEALTDERLAVEREQILGTLASSKSVYSKANFTRASTGTQTFSDGAFGYAATNIPRVGGDGGGVLVEEQRQNIALQSQTMGTTWFVSQGALSADSSTVLAPDGTATADGIIADADDESHFIGQTLTTTAVNHTFSVYARMGNKQWVTLAHNGVANGFAIFDVDACRFYLKGAGALAALATAAGNSWCRVSMTFLAPAASGIIYFGPRLSAATGAYPGNAAVNMWFWGAQLEIGSHATSYIPTTSAAVIRYADSLTYDPWSISKNMFASGAVTPMMWYNFDQPVYSGSTTTTSGGNYTLTTVGNPKMYALPNDSTYTEFNGSTDYFSIPNGGGGSDFNVGSNNFSVVMLITPTSLLSSTSLFGKYLPAGNKRQWLIQQTAVGIDLLTSSNGIAASVLSKAGGGLAIGKTSLITVTYTAGTGASAIYVDAASAATGNTATSVYSADGAVEIGSNGGGANPFNGRIHFLSYTNHGTGPVITQAQHDAMLIRIKDARSLPVKIGNSYENKKLYVEFESK